MTSIPEVQNMMDERYAAGTAYKSDLPFDAKRGVFIRAATLRLAHGAGLLTSQTRTLDVGSGEGGIASFWPHKSITGVEISKEAIKKAKANLPNVRYVCCPIEQYELGAGEKPYDLIVAQESIEHWTDASAGMDAICKAIEKSGRLIITTPNRDSLHCRMSRKLELGEAPFCSDDHIHEFGFDELIGFVEGKGFELEASIGVGLLPYWSMEQVFGSQVRFLTDTDEQVVDWFHTMGCSVPPEFAFIQCHRFSRSLRKMQKEKPCQAD